MSAAPNMVLLVEECRCLRKDWGVTQASVWSGLVKVLYKPLGTHSQALSKHFTDAAKWHLEIQYIGLRNILTSAAFVYNLGIMYDAVSDLCDLSKHLKERHNIARSLFWGVKADSGFCINGWQSWLFCWRGCQCFSEHVLKKNKNLCTRGNVLKAVTENFLGVLKITYIAKCCSQGHWKLALLCIVFLAENHTMWLHTSW